MPNRLWRLFLLWSIIEYVCPFNPPSIVQPITEDFHSRFEQPKTSVNVTVHPIVEEEKTEYARISSNFSLNCIFDMELGGLASMTWDYPGKQKQGNSNQRYVVQKPTGSSYKTPGMSTSVKRIQSRITVLHAQKMDEGFYTCKVIHNLKETINKTYVEVKSDDLEPYINITMTPHKEYISTVEKTAAKIVFHLVSSFSRKDLTVEFFKNGRLLRQSKRINILNSFHRENRSIIFEEVLTINSVARNDTGNYTIVAENGEYKDEKTVLLFVQAPPIAHVVDDLELYNYNEQYTLYCVVDGFPIDNVSWKWRQCYDFDSCSSLWSDIDNITYWDNHERLNDINKTLPYKPQRSLEVTAKQSGEYLCLGSNNLGYDNITTKFTVTDVEGGFGITAPRNKVFQGDDVELMCKVNLFKFSNIFWYIVDSDSTKVPLEDSVNEWQITNGNTSYSLMSRISARNIAITNETIICEGRHLDGLGWLNKSYTLVIYPASKPQFLSNQTTSKLELEVGRSGALDCTSTGVPQPSVSWYQNNQLVQNPYIIKTGPNGQILNITVALKGIVDGTYKCVVQNRRGVGQRTFNVYVKDNESAPTETMALAVVLTIIIIIFLVVVFCWIRRVRKDREEKAELKALCQELFNKGEIERLNHNLALDNQVELLPYDHSFEFPKERLKMGSILGQGAFGRVVQAEAIGLEDEGSTTVAVKMLKERADKTQRKALVAELKILIHLGKHLNIVNLLGAVTKNMMKGELLVMVEFCRYGNLRSYLLKRKYRFINQLDPVTGLIDPDLALLPRSPVRAQLAANQGLKNPIYGLNSPDLMDVNDSGNSCNMSVVPSSPTTTNAKYVPFTWLLDNDDDDLCQPVTTCDLLCYAFQVARGMQYLASRKLLHRDLAARNVLLADDNVVKICDFGLAKDCYNYDIYRMQGNGLLPVKWMALESISDKVFTIKSDVWSFGILLWEFFTLGGDPYPGVDLDEEFFKRLKGGYRMDKPDYAPNNVYRIMLHCWNSDPENRPDFETLGDFFGDFLQASVKESYLELDNQYTNMNSLRKPIDYLTISETTFLNTNHDDSPVQFVNYEIVSHVRPVNNEPAPPSPMLAVPNIQLEPIDIHNKILKKNKIPDFGSDNSKRETNYLMHNGVGETKSLLRQRNCQKSLGPGSDTSSGYLSDLDTNAESNEPPYYNSVMAEEEIGIEVC